LKTEQKLEVATGWAFVLCALLIATVAFVITLPQRFKDAIDWPAWVQAVGSIAAIGVAVWVFAAQNKIQRDRDDDNERKAVLRLLLALRDEIYTTMQATNLTFGKDIRAAVKGKGIRVVFYMNDRAFKIYNNNVDKIGSIPEDDLRHAVIAAYARFELFLILMKINNDTLADYTDAFNAMPQPNTISVDQDQRRKLEEYLHDRWIKSGDTVIDEFETCIACAEDLLKRLDSAIAVRRH
jgi:hypothetical protein